jgi:hypothetical protein
MSLKFNPLTPPFDYYEASTPTAPGGSDTQFQYNDGGAFAGCPNFLYNKTTKQFTFGSGEAGVDYGFTFNGETQDGAITFLEDEGTFAFTRQSGTPFIYSGYEPTLSVTTREGNCTAVQFYATVGAKTGMGEVFSFWGGVFDEGNNAKSVTAGGYGAAGIFAYNAMWGQNARTYLQLAAISGITETSGSANLTVTDLAGGIFQYNDYAGAGDVYTRASGVWIKDGAGATTAYGLRIDDISSAGTSNSYSVYTGKGIARFGTAFSCQQVGASAGTAKVGFFGATNVAKQTALTTQLTSLTHTAPGTPDYAIQDLTAIGGYGFVSKDEGNTVLSCILNLQTRMSEAETKLKNYGLFT